MSRFDKPKNSIEIDNEQVSLLSIHNVNATLIPSGRAILKHPDPKALNKNERNGCAYIRCFAFQQMKDGKPYGPIPVIKADFIYTRKSQKRMTVFPQLTQGEFHEKVTLRYDYGAIGNDPHKRDAFLVEMDAQEFVEKYEQFRKDFFTIPEDERKSVIGERMRANDTALQEQNMFRKMPTAKKPTEQNIDPESESTPFADVVDLPENIDDLFG